jgi:hypothetical protein
MKEHEEERKKFFYLLPSKAHISFGTVIKVQLHSVVLIASFYSSMNCI